MKKGFDRPVDRSVELGLGLCYQQSVYGGWGHWLRDAGRGLWRAARLSPEARVIADIAVIGKPKPTTEALRHGERTRAEDRKQLMDKAC